MKKKVALLLHGFPGLSPNDKLGDYLKSLNYDVIVPDLFDPSVNFNAVDIQKYIYKKLGGKTPDVILAFSLGGLIAPFIASKYPNSKLVMIATGPRIEVGIKPYNYLIKNLNSKYLKLIHKGFNYLPLKVYKIMFDFFNPYRGISERKSNYYRDIEDTFAMFKRHKLEKLKEILLFARLTDTAEVLKKLENRTLIIIGGNDVLMPNKLSFELKDYIKDCQLIENKDRLHFEVFDDRDFENLDEFLNSK